MSTRELERVEVMGRVASEDLKLSDAAVMLELSYRQAKRLWRRYCEITKCHGNLEGLQPHFALVFGAEGEKGPV